MHPSAQPAGPPWSNQAPAKRIVVPGGPCQYYAVHQYSVVRRVWGASGVYMFLIFAPPTPPQNLIARSLSTPVRCRAASHFRAKASLVQPASPASVVDGPDVWPDEEKREKACEWRLFKVMGDIQLSHLCEPGAGATLEVVANVSDLWGDFSTLEAVPDKSKHFQRVDNVLFYNYYHRGDECEED